MKEVIFINSVIIVAGGSGSRMNMDINKQFIKLNNKEIILHTIDKFYNNKNIDEIVVVIKKEEENYFNEIIKKYDYKDIKISYAGKERQDSVFNGINSLNKNTEIVLVHDGARPFVDDFIINNSINEAKKIGALVVGVKVKDTIKVVKNNEIESTLKRDELISVQTPQTFKYDVLKKAYLKAYEDNFYGTDDSSLVERLGIKVKVIDGSYDNIKITTKEDLVFSQEIIKKINS